MADVATMHFKIAPENAEWLRSESRSSGISQVKLVNILIEFARKSGMHIKPDVTSNGKPS